MGFSSFFALAAAAAAVFPPPPPPYTHVIIYTVNDEVITKMHIKRSEMKREKNQTFYFNCNKKRLTACSHVRFSLSLSL